MCLTFCLNFRSFLTRFCVSPSSGGRERVKGIEPSYAAWEAAVLPLNYTRFFFGSGGHCQEIASSGVSLDDVPL